MSNRVAEHADIHRLSDDDVEACVERPAPVLGFCMPGARDGGRTPALCFAIAHAPYQLVTVFDRHANI
jgi:hypothetical protein